MHGLVGDVWVIERNVWASGVIYGTNGVKVWFNGVMLVVLCVTCVIMSGSIG